MDKLRDVEVICHYSTEGKITPLRVKLVDEDGQRQAFIIKEYRDLSGQGARTMPDGIYVADNTYVYECRICVFERLRLIRLYFNPRSKLWKMTG